MTLRPFQKEALAALETPCHLICVAPTGSGKSLIYETLLARRGWRTLLVSPLVALSRQQAARLEALGIRTGAGSDVRIISPESLTPRLLRELRVWRPEFLVVDECHCVWDWGERFRPAFNRISESLHALAIPRSLWLTATLPPEAREDLRRKLPAPVREVGSFALPDHLELQTLRVPWSHRLDAVLSWVRRHREPGILFAPTRELAEKLARVFTAEGARTSRSVAHYHAGMSREERVALEERFHAGEIELVVATSAFGLGIHQTRLRWAALWQAPPSLLALAQFLGRAGRDPKLPSTGMVFWDLEDFRIAEWTLAGSARRKEDYEAVYEFLTSNQCRRTALSNYFNTERRVMPMESQI